MSNQFNANKAVEALGVGEVVRHDMQGDCVSPFVRIPICDNDFTHLMISVVMEGTMRRVFIRKVVEGEDREILLHNLMLDGTDLRVGYDKKEQSVWFGYSTRIPMSFFNKLVRPFLTDKSALRVDHTFVVKYDGMITTQDWSTP